MIQLIQIRPDRLIHGIDQILHLLRSLPHHIRNFLHIFIQHVQHGLNGLHPGGVVELLGQVIHKCLRRLPGGVEGSLQAIGLI